VELGPIDEVTPPLFTQISDGMRITARESAGSAGVRKIRNALPGKSHPERGTQPRRRTSCPVWTERRAGSLLSGDEPRWQTRGSRANSHNCYHSAARCGHLRCGPTGELDPVQIDGTLAYISNGNAWVMRGVSSNKRLLTTSGDLDNRVFALTPDGRQLLLIRKSAEPNTYFNQLWAGQRHDQRLAPSRSCCRHRMSSTPIGCPTRPIRSVIRAAKSPTTAPVGRLTTTFGSCGSILPPAIRSTRANWSTAPAAGSIVGGALASSGRPDGQKSWPGCARRLVGAGHTDTGELQTLLTYPVFSTRQPLSWRATVSWSPDNSLILTTVHGQPIGSEPAETSPAFHNTVADLSGAFNANVVQNAGIWSKPKYSPLTATGAGYIAYLRARDLANSISESAEYDLVVADRDGSNARVVYPPAGQPGLTANSPYFAWSSSGTQIAFIYGGNLWVVDVESAVAHQLTLDKGASSPVWTQ